MDINKILYKAIANCSDEKIEHIERLIKGLGKYIDPNNYDYEDHLVVTPLENENMFNIFKLLLLHTNPVKEEVLTECATTAVSLGNLGAIKILKDNTNINFESLDKYGDTPLYAAIRKSQFNIVKYLIELCKVDINTQNDTGNIALHMAVRKNDEEMVLYLLKNGADVNIKDNWGSTALHFASSFKSITLMLLLKDARVNLLDHNGKTALYYAVQENREDVANLLMSYGANPDLDTDEGSILHWAVYNKNTSLIKTLLTYDKVQSQLTGVVAEFDKKFHHDIVATVFASKKIMKFINLPKLFKLAIEKQSVMLIETIDDYDESIVDDYVHENMDNVDPILFATLNFDEIFVDGDSYLIYAMKQSMPLRTIKKLIECIDDINYQNESGFTALHYALLFKYNINVIKSLLDKGADLNVCTAKTKESPLIIAVRLDNDIEVIKLLLDRGADAGIKDGDKLTALDYAVIWNKSDDICKLLI